MARRLQSPLGGRPSGERVDTARTNGERQVAAFVERSGPERTMRIMQTRPATLTLAPALAILLSLPGLASVPAGGSTVAADTATALRDQAEAATGRPVRLDPRLRIPPCASGFTFESGAASVAILCPASGWRLIAPMGGGVQASAPSSGPEARALPVIRRGDLVRVIQAGPGFTIALEAVAESAGAPGDRILLRNRLTGARFPATIGEDGVASAGR